MNYEFKIDLNSHSHSHFYSHFDFFKIGSSYLRLILLAFFNNGAGEGNRTLVTGIVVLSGVKALVLLAFSLY
jgi:hypothetical protein